MRDKRAAGIHQNYKSVMKFLYYDLYPECKEDKIFQDYQTEIRRNIVIDKIK